MTIRVLGIDLETTGLDFKKDEIIEIGYSIREFENNLWMPKALNQRSLFIWEDRFPDPMPPEAYEVHKISSWFLKEVGDPYDYQFSSLRQVMLLFNVDMLLAHNGLAFDKPFLEAKGFVTELPWVDSKIHITYPKSCKQHSLMYLAAYHGFLNPFPHDAMMDVNTMFKIVEQYDFNKIVERSKEKWLKVKADVKFDTRELARARNYQWNPTLKHWEKNLPESELKIEREEAPFGTILL